MHDLLHDAVKATTLAAAIWLPLSVAVAVLIGRMVHARETESHTRP
ncbi:hypothetical protein [Subtercola frigoramans]|uniref:Membrane protein implicated in regulation of membrane protease activity n=1 Tax=Subtercola frigoramans TaxID=120298 RepID=A0ABS2L282_9MICO|nr:hypothetical protein [Subtercola frigoramans]MBM7471182.1 membrane protein implicated in regulation of membrane protease activity [Subtercola frigoramans]